MSPRTASASLTEPSFIELFTPKLVTVFREGYGWPDLRADAISGLTVAVVALPLSMAIAIASGASPERGLYTAIVGGLIISLIGGSRFQIGGPAGAFIGLVAGVVERHGYDGLALATIVAGLILIAIGLLRAGTYIKYIPFPVTVGFTAGIAVIIAASQIRDLLGLTIAHEPSALLPKLSAIRDALPTAHLPTVAIAVMSVALIVVLRRLRPNWPSFLIAVSIAAIVCTVFHLDVATVHSRFGAIPRSLPIPSLPPFSLEKLQAVLPDAVAIALLGAIESLSSAVVADGMTGRRHRSNCELSAQGVANITSVLFGGICVTGTVARTATNVRAGARGARVGHFSLRLSANLSSDRGTVSGLHLPGGSRRSARRGCLEYGGKGGVLVAFARLSWRCSRTAVDLSTYDFRRPRHRHRRWRCTGRAAVPASNGGSGRSRRRSNNA
jgi:SulP family sulfate permease